MTSVNRKTAGVLIAGGAAAAIAVGVGAAARADTQTPTPSPTTSSAPGRSGTAPGQQASPGQGGNSQGNGNGKGLGWGPGGRHGMGGFGGMGRFGLGGDVAALAQKLGVDESKLRTALGAVRDQLKAERKADKTNGSTPPRMGALSDDAATRLAKELGISADKVKTAIADLRAAAQASRQQAFDSRLGQAVKDGKLTQAEADAVKKAARLGVIGMGGRG
ncbi:Clp protease N-terminal domain-containing protein [Intrasporangium chromatireducens]|uniref:Clp protease N-terminal domain-containing protein n=1 Tax=Intrasporangium chromatireducens TaxID=1386088 RepID=UPI0004AFFFAA|nr:Clp protease N-terminal domain-containing protein [Intrasporangium chromatireducens]